MKNFTAKKICLIVACTVFVMMALSALNISFTPINLISAKEMSQITASHTKSDFIGNILYDGTALPYDNLTKYMFLPISQGDNLSLKDIPLSSLSKTEISFLDDGFFDDIALSVAQNKTATLILHNKKEYCEYKIKFTFLPILQLQYTQKSEDNYTVDEYGNIEYQPIYNSQLTLFLPFDSNVQSHSATHNASYRLRGSSSLVLDKKNYKVNLLGKKSKALEVSVFDMPADNDWILYSLHTDDSFVREKIISELWTQAAAQNSTRPMRSFEMQYTELFLNDEYNGLYSIMELVDKKLLDLDYANDILYKCIGWNLPTDTEYANNAQSTAIPYTDIEIKHMPATLQDSPWLFIQKYFATYSMTPGEDAAPVLAKGVSLAEAYAVSDIQNIIDYAIFESLFLLFDNNPKNTYYLTHNTQNGTILLKTFWDLNYSFGNIISENISQRLTATVEKYDYPFYNEEINRLLLGSDKDAVIAMICDRWQQLRKDILSKDNLFNKIDDYSVFLIKSGATLRNEQRWGTPNDYPQQITRLKTFLENRLLNLDNQFLNMKEGGDYIP